MAGETAWLRGLLGRIPPVLCLAGAHLVGYLMGAEVGEGALPALCAGGASAAVGVFTLASRSKARLRPVSIILVLGCFLLSGFSRGAHNAGERESFGVELRAFNETGVRVLGTVLGFPSTIPEGSRFPMEVAALEGGGRSVQWKHGGPRLLITVKPQADVHYGDFLCLTGKMSLPAGPRNPGGFDYAEFLSRRGLHGRVKCKKHEVTLLGEGYGRALYSHALAPVRRGIGEMVGARLDGEARSLLRGLLLGDRALLDPELRYAMAQAGVVHIMAVSGLHVGLMAVILGWGARCARMSVRSAEVFSLVGVWLYCGIVGLPASACRAACLASAYVICRRLQRPGASFGALGAAGFVMVLLKPEWAKGPGFQLSFSAAAGVLAFKDSVLRYSSRLGREPGPRQKSAATLVGASLGAQITSWPVVAFHFGRTPILFLVGNAVAIPLVGIVLTWGLAAVAFTLVSHTLVGWVLASCWAATSALTAFCLSLGSIPWASATVPAFSPLFVGVYFLALLAAASSNGRPRLCALGVLVTAALCMCIGLPGHSRGEELEVAFLDVGHGDACVFLAPTGETMLVDAGANERGWDAGMNVIAPYLRERGVRSIDRAVISHGDGDHWGGLAALSERAEIKEVVLPRGVPLGPLEELLPELEARGAALLWAEAGDTLPVLGELECVVLHPSPGFEKAKGGELGDHLNDRSLVLRVTFGHVVVLMTGDVEAVAECWLAGESGKFHGPRPGGGCRDFAGFAGGSGALVPSAALLECTVLKVPHHGSDTSSSAEFVSAASPLVAVLSCGPKDLFNLPKPQVIERYRAGRVTLFQTVRDGAVVLRTDGRTVTALPYLRPAERLELRVTGE